MLQPPGAHRQTGLSPACPVGCLSVCLGVSTFLVYGPVVCRPLSVSVCPSPSSVSLSFRLSVRRLLCNHLHAQTPNAVAERPTCEVASTLRRQTDTQANRQTGRQAVCLPLGLRLVCRSLSCLSVSVCPPAWAAAASGSSSAHHGGGKRMPPVCVCSSPGPFCSVSLSPCLSVRLPVCPPACCLSLCLATWHPDRELAIAREA